jgi:enoyl-CoA hydratase
VSKDLILVEKRSRVGVATLNRPKPLNALNAALREELDQALLAIDRDPEIGAVIVTGGAEAFAVGADISEMRGKNYPAIYVDFFATCDRIAVRRSRASPLSPATRLAAAASWR